MASVDELPDYAPMLSAYHEAHADELRAMVGTLPIRPGDRVLDLACGDGAYSCWLAERVGADGKVVAVDLSPAYLTIARRRASRVRSSGRIQFVAADFRYLPYPEGTFDLVWCAQSLYSLPDPVDVLCRMRRLARPRGMVGVLENDTLHHVLLPWPIEIELAARRAELLSFVEESEKPRKFYIGRQLCDVFAAAGLSDCRRKTWATNRQTPLTTAERAFLEEYLRDLRERAAPHLEPAILERFERLVDPDSDAYLLDLPHFSVTFLDHVVWAEKPAGEDD